MRSRPTSSRSTQPTPSRAPPSSRPARFGSRSCHPPRRSLAKDGHLMDLRLTSGEPTAAERDAVDALLGAPDSAWVGGQRGADGHSSRGGHEARARRDQLLPALHDLQSRVGWISPEALGYVCRRLTVPPAEAYGVASFYALFAP